MSSMQEPSITTDSFTDRAIEDGGLRPPQLRLMDSSETVALRSVPTVRRLSGPARRLLATVMKRALDIVCASVALIVAVPLLAIIALTVKVSSPGPVIFGHRRVGRNGVQFTCLKFRTMVQDADRALEDLFEAQPELRQHFEEHFKLPRDPRVTRVGHWLRRTSLDEFPQFWNVLRGDMSVVGPRPVVADEVAKYGALQDELLSVRPGVTGRWQISGRSDLDYAERVSLDIGYIRDRTFWGDVAIILRTVRSVVSVGGNGAY